MSKPKLLFLNVNRTGWHSGNMIYDMEAIKMACDTVVYGPGWPNYESNDLKKIINQVYGNDKPDIIYSYFTPNEKVGKVYMDHYKIPPELGYFPVGFNEVKGPIKIFGLSDFWSRSRQQYYEDLKDADFQYCFCCFTPPYSHPKDFYSFFDSSIIKKIKFVAHPRCVDAKCFAAYHDFEKKELDVVTAGAMSSFYPFRQWMAKEVAMNMRHLKTRNYSYCGVNFGHNGFVREKYAEAISNSKILASCGGRYHLFFNKMIESMGCGTAYFGEKPHGYKELGFEDEKNCVFVSRENFKEKVDYYLKNEKLLKVIIKNGRELFAGRHTIEKRAEDFGKLIVNL